jgi:hypothetical protein
MGNKNSVKQKSILETTSAVTQCPVDPNTGICTMGSMAANNVGYGTTDNSYMDSTESHHGYFYKTGCGAGCDSSGNYSKSEADACDVTKHHNNCTSKAFDGISNCCQGLHSPTENGGFDSYYCRSGSKYYFPWSKDCVDSPDGQAVIQAYCEELASDGSGKPNIIAVPNCQTWCANVEPGICDNAKSNFCLKNPDNEYCQCVLRGNDPLYVQMKEAGMGDFNAGCWYTPCSLSPAQMLIQSDIKTDENSCPDTVCQNVISIIDSGDVTISNVNQGSISCGNLPTTYTCNSDSVCAVDSKGEFENADDCINSGCGKPVGQKYNCDPVSGCVAVDDGGTYETLTDCQNACSTPTPTPTDSPDWEEYALIGGGFALLLLIILLFWLISKK